MTRAPASPVSALGAWVSLDVEGRRRWLVQASQRYFHEGGHRHVVQRPAGVTLPLDVSGVRDLEGFLCALGEAVNGPQGYFGLHLDALGDCLVGGFGMTSPWTLSVSSEDHLATVLDDAARVRRAEERLALGDFLVEEGRQWLLEAARNTERRTLWDEIREQLTLRGVTVVSTR